MTSGTVILKPTPPFRLDLTVWALRRRARNVVDRWDGAVYKRVLTVGDALVEVEAQQTGASEQPWLEVRITGTSTDRHVQQEVANALTRMLALKTDLREFYAVASHDKRLSPLAEHFRGVKPPRFPTVFEALVNAFACQQLSLTVGIELLNRLASRCGPALHDNERCVYGFPRPEGLLHVNLHRLRSLGFSYSKARSIKDLCRSVTTGEVDFAQLESFDETRAIESLLQLRGVGRWTAEYVLLRGLGRTCVFPGDDVGAQNRLARWLGRRHPLDYDGVKRAVARWSPFAGLVYFHLLLAGLADSGELTSGALSSDDAGFSATSRTG